MGAFPVERQSLSGCPLFDPSVGPFEARLTRELLTNLANDLPRDGVAFAWGARADTPLYEFLVSDSERLPFRVVGYGQLYHRRLIELPRAMKIILRCSAPRHGRICGGTNDGWSRPRRTP